MKDGEKRPVIALALVTAFCLTGDSMLYVALPLYWRVASRLAARSGAKVRIVTMHTVALDIGAALGPVIGYALALDVVYRIAAVALFLMGGRWFFFSGIDERGGKA
ncbi:hypothetical protein BSNK01_13400 [Bacillaceae bacterium]